MQRFDQLMLNLYALFVFDEVLFALIEQHVLLLVGVLAVGEETLQQVDFALQLLVVRADGKIFQFDSVANERLVA